MRPAHDPGFDPETGTAGLVLPGMFPRANRAWTIVITARTRRGTPLTGRVRYEYLYGGQVVAHRSNYRFTHRHFRDTIRWPSASIGISLIFRPVITTKLGVIRLPYSVRVRG